MEEAGGSTANAPASAKPMAIPKHITQDDPAIMSFSPSKMSTQTLDHFNHEDSKGMPLESSWTFWIDKAMHNASLNEYKANIKKVYTVSTAQGFWSVFNHIPNVSELRLRCYYHLMRDEREPVWEDPVLANGGVWRIKCPKYHTPYVWKELLLAAIGEQFIDFLHEDDEICGLSVSPREKDDLIQIWNLNSKAVQQSRVLEKVHSLVPDVRFNAEFYKPHQTHSAFGKQN